MDVAEYFSKLNDKSKEIFELSIVERDSLGILHNLSHYIFEFAEQLSDGKEKELMLIVTAQLESSTYNLTIGQYRQALSSLRLALELGLGVIYFSAYRVEMNEWISGKRDIVWSSLIDRDNGVLSKRFVNSFYEELSGFCDKYNDDARTVYRDLSEFVHGNIETWALSGAKISFNKQLFLTYIEKYKIVCRVILFSAFCRYGKYFDSNAKDNLCFIPEEFNNITEVRQAFGLS